MASTGLSSGGSEEMALERRGGRDQAMWGQQALFLVRGAPVLQRLNRMLEEVGFDRRLRSGLDGFVAAVIRFDSISTPDARLQKQRVIQRSAKRNKR
jgi:hypothetical protein